MLLLILIIAMLNFRKRKKDVCFVLYTNQNFSENKYQHICLFCCEIHKMYTRLTEYSNASQFHLRFLYQHIFNIPSNFSVALPFEIFKNEKERKKIVCKNTNLTKTSKNENNSIIIIYLQITRFYQFHNKINFHCFFSLFFLSNNFLFLNISNVSHLLVSLKIKQIQN